MSTSWQPLGPLRNTLKEELLGGTDLDAILTAFKKVLAQAPRPNIDCLYLSRDDFFRIGDPVTTVSLEEAFVGDGNCTCLVSLNAERRYLQRKLTIRNEASALVCRQLAAVEAEIRSERHRSPHCRQGIWNGLDAIQREIAETLWADGAPAHVAVETAVLA